MRLLFICFMVATAYGCSKSTNNHSAVELKDVAYGSFFEQKMDIYLPADRNTSSTKSILLIHGGAWTSGDKTELNEAIAWLRTQLPNWAFFNINHRLAATTGANAWPAQQADIQTAVNFILSKQAEYGINPSKICIGGASSGAHLALVQAYGTTTIQYKAAIDLFGPTDMIDLFNNPPNAQLPALLQIFLSGTPTTNPSNYLQASPLFKVSASSPPTLILHGDADALVHKRQSDSLNARLVAAGVAKQYQIYPGEGHGFSTTAMNDALIKMVAFVKQHNP
jgi:acetyl esterase/lipase